MSAWLLTVKVIVDKGRPKFLQIFKRRKSETAINDKNETWKYSVTATCQNVSCLLLQIKSHLEKDAVSADTE